MLQKWEGVGRIFNMFHVQMRFALIKWRNPEQYVNIYTRNPDINRLIQLVYEGIYAIFICTFWKFVDNNYNIILEKSYCRLC